jgi:hypothetical protein
MMRLFFAVFLLVFAAAELTASEQYPYFASVAVMELPVRSGPGPEYYPTSQLRLGDKVEVYYETEDWCAVRPPIGSFSWISAQYVQLGTNHIGNVIAEGLASRVGSDNTELCDTVQVKLRKGEKVLVLDRYETPENAASPLWFKIAPPSGEFRWIPRSALIPTHPPISTSTPISKQIQKNSPRSIVQVDYETETKTTSAVQTAPIVPPPTRPVRLPASARPANPPANEKNKNLTNTASPQKTPIDFTSLSAKLAMNQPAAATQINPVKEPDPFQKAFEELKEETRIALVRPTEDWVFDTLIHRGNELYEVATSKKDIEKTYQLVETLQRTKTVRQEIVMRRQFHSTQLLAPPISVTPFPANDSSNPVLPRPLPVSATNSASNPILPSFATNSGAPAPMSTGSSKTTAISAKTLTDNQSTDFDVVGKLGAFDPLPKGHPPYAVVNDEDEIICLVSPETKNSKPVINLQPFLGKTVGINGVLGFFEKPNQPNRRHVEAREAMTIEK